MTAIIQLIVLSLLICNIYMPNHKRTSIIYISRSQNKVVYLKLIRLKRNKLPINKKEEKVLNLWVLFRLELK